MGTLTGFVLGYVVGAQTGPDTWKRVREAAQQLADSEQGKALRESARQMLHSALQTMGDGRPDWRAIANRELLTGVVSRGQALLSGLVDRGSTVAEELRQRPRP